MRKLAIGMGPMLAALALAGCLAMPHSAGANEEAGAGAGPAKIDLIAFEDWRDSFRTKALEAGISKAVFEKALGGVQPNPRVQELNEHQPEHARAIWDYIEGAANDRRIARGQELLRTNEALLGRVGSDTKVDPKTLVAIWGLETDFGGNLGAYNIFEALATLAYRGRRTAYGEAQLLAALRIVERGDKPAERLVGSWAGAMGQTQFIPTTYLDYAVDADGDGRRDLFDSIPDVMASTANYLAKHGWKEGLSWGREVVLPEGFDYDLADPAVRLRLAAWSGMGVKLMGGGAIEASERTAALVLPAGYRGPAFLVEDNFFAILKYNNSTAYALAIGHLSDRFGGAGPIKGAWPRDERPLTLSERIEMQTLLAALGYRVGAADGIVGAQTRAGLKQYQRAKGLPADGFATIALLETMRKDAAALGTGSVPAPGTASPPPATPAPEPPAGPAPTVPAAPLSDAPGSMEPVHSPGDPASP